MLVGLEIKLQIMMMFNIFHKKNAKVVSKQVSDPFALANKKMGSLLTDQVTSQRSHRQSAGWVRRLRHGHQVTSVSLASATCPFRSSGWK